MFDSHANPSADRQTRLERVLADYLHSVENGQPLDRSALIVEHPDLADDLQSFFRNHDSIGRLAEPLQALVDAPTIAGPSDVGTAMTGNSVRYFGDYELLDEIARGGMGVVFKARQVNLNRIVALKMILAGQLANDSDVKRFYAEAEAAAKLDHSGIVPIFEIGQHDGQHYFSMAFVEGESLAKKVANGPLPPHEAAALVKTIAEAVEYAHQKGIIHRDLKPANVLLDAEGHPKVTDFGLAKQIKGDSGLTGTGQILGTPSYMPPEQAAGKIDQVGPQADVYSLGAVLYCLLTGRPPFQAASPMDTLMQVLEQEPLAPRQLNPQVPLDLETIALKCLEKEVSRRYANATDLAGELGRFLRGEPILARPVGIVDRTWRWCKRNRVVAGLTAAVASALIVGTIVSSYFAVEERHRAVLESKAREEALTQKGIADENARRADQSADTAREEATRATRLAGELEKSLTAESEARATADDEADNARRAAAKEAEARQATRRSLYGAQMNLAWQAWDQGNMGQVEEVLEAHKSARDDEDLRGFEWYHLWWLAHRYQTSIPSAFYFQGMWWVDPKTRTLAMKSVQGFTLWSLDSGKVQAHCPMQYVPKEVTQTLLRPVLSPDLTTAALPGTGNTLQLWSLVSSKAGPKLEYDQPVVSTAYSPDGSTLVTGGEAGTLIAWNVTEGRRLWTRTVANPDDAAPSPNTAVKQVEFSPDGTRLVTLAFDSAQIWDAQTGALRGLLTRKLGDPRLIGVTLQFSADGKFVVIAGFSADILIWNVESLEEHVVERALDDSAHGMAISPDSRTLATGGQTIRLRDLSTGKERTSFPGMKDRSMPMAIAFTPDSRLLAVTTDRSTIDLHDAKSGEVRRTLRGHNGQVTGIAITNDGRRLVSRSIIDRSVKIWDLSDTRRPSLLLGHKGAVRALAFAPSGELLSVDAAGTLKRWDARSGTELSSLQLAIDQSPPDMWSDAELSPDGGSVVICTPDKVGHVLDCTTGNERFRCTAPQVWSKHRDFSDDGTLFAAYEGDRVRVWDTVSGEVRANIPQQPGLACLAFHPDGKRLVTADHFRECLWNIVDGKPQSSIWNPVVGGLIAPHVLTCSPDGRILAAGCMDRLKLSLKTVQLWDLGTRKEIPELKGEQTGVDNLVFSPDSKTLVLSVFESPPRLKLWNVAVRWNVGTLRSASSSAPSPILSPVSAMAFSRDGRLLAHGNSDGTIDLFWGETDE